MNVMHSNRCMVPIWDARYRQKGKATTDHLVVLKETIKEIRKQKKTVYMVFLDVTKAYDKACLHAIMYLMHKEGLKGPEWDLVK